MVCIVLAVCHAPVPRHTRSNATALHLQGAVVEYSCIGGYEATGGDFIRMCKAVNEKPIWDGQDLECSLLTSTSK